MDAFANEMVDWHRNRVNMGVDLGFVWVGAGLGWSGRGGARHHTILIRILLGLEYFYGRFALFESLVSELR